MKVTYHLESLSLTRNFVISLTRRKRVEIEGEVFESLWSTTVEPDLEVSLIKELSRDGAVLNEEFSSFINTFLQPALMTLWQGLPQNDSNKYRDF